MTSKVRRRCRLETAARRPGEALPCPAPTTSTVARPTGLALNLYPLFNQLVEETTPERGAAHFHASLVDGLVH